MDELFKLVNERIPLATGNPPASAAQPERHKPELDSPGPQPWARHYGGHQQYAQNANGPLPRNDIRNINNYPELDGPFYPEGHNIDDVQANVERSWPQPPNRREPDFKPDRIGFFRPADPDVRGPPQIHESGKTIYQDVQAFARQAQIVLESRMWSVDTLR